MSASPFNRRINSMATKTGAMKSQPPKMAPAGKKVSKPTKGKANCASDGTDY